MTNDHAAFPAVRKAVWSKVSPSRNCLRHGRTTKYVDASPFTKGRLLPNDWAHILSIESSFVYAAFSSENQYRRLDRAADHDWGAVCRHNKMWADLVFFGSGFPELESNQGFNL